MISRVLRSEISAYVSHDQCSLGNFGEHSAFVFVFHLIGKETLEEYGDIRGQFALVSLGTIQI